MNRRNGMSKRSERAAGRFLSIRRQRNRTWSLICAEVLIAAHVMLLLPAPARAATPPPPAPVSPLSTLLPEPSQGQSPGRSQRETRPPNRDVPDVDPPSLYPSFSLEPTDEEIFRARVFREPLIPMEGETNVRENRALADALIAYLAGGDTEDFRPLRGFLNVYPRSRWRASLLTNLGIVYARTGFFSRAKGAFEEAWHLSKASDDPSIRDLADLAITELMDLYMPVGDLVNLERLLFEFEGREMKGSTNEKRLKAEATVWGLNNAHHLAIPSGRVAVERLFVLEKPNEMRHPQIDSLHPTMDGATLTEVEDLAGRVGLNLQRAYRQNKNQARIPVPSLAHLKGGHFTAVVAERNGRYMLDDPLLGGEIWMSREAFEEESTGYFLVAGGRLAPGWRKPSPQEVDGVRGKCHIPEPDEGHTREEDSQSGGGGEDGDGGTPEEDGEVTGEKEKEEEEDTDGGNGSGPTDGYSSGGSGDSCPGGMAVYSFHEMRASLHITDNPVGCSAPIGPSVPFRAVYNQREAGQPQTFTYSNLGHQWTHNWLAFIEDDPAALGDPVKLFVRGGGYETYKGFENNVSAPQFDSRAIMAITSTNPIEYERRLANGWMEVYGQPDGAVAPRKVFLTEVRDPYGNAATLTYDGQLRLVAITDAIGQVTTLSYEMLENPLRITKVTDPFDRYATFEYDGDEKLVAITDVIGMSSEFTYGSGDFIRSMTTPYGTTTFRGGTFPLAVERYLEATDPLGGTERIEWGDYANLLPSSDPTEDVPTGFAGKNNGLKTHVSVYWNKLAMSEAEGDPNKGVVTKWLMTDTYKITGYHRHSVKKPLENRVWYAYDGNWSSDQAGPLGRPSKIARVLDDGSSQIYRYEYNAVGKLLRRIDPLGRELLFVYGTETTPDPDPSTGTGIDLLEVKVKNGTVYETLAEFTYNAQHSRLAATDALGNTYTYTYNQEGQLLTATTAETTEAPSGATTTLTYDEDGYLLTVSGPISGSTTTYTYDSFGRVDTITPPLQDTVTFDYDDLNRFTKVTFEDTTYQEIVYNRLDAERIRDRLGRWSQFHFDAVRRLVASADAEGRTVGLEWCTCGVLEALVDANGNRTRWERDDQGRVTKEIRPNSAEIVYVYEDTTSRLETVTDPKSIVTTFEYFLDNRLKKKSYSDTTPDVTYTYDYLGRPASAANGTDQLSWTYNLNGWVISEESTKNSSTVSYEYDEVGNRRVLKLDGTTFSTYGHDSGLRLDSITRGSGEFGFGYDAASRRTSMDYPNGIVTTYEYDTESRLERITAERDATVITDFQYTYNTAGNRTEKETPDYTETYRYDRADQLVEVVRTGAAANRWNYAYDPTGNRTTEQIGDAPVQASYDNMNRLLSTSAGGALVFKGSLNEPATVTVDGTPAIVDSSDNFQGIADSTSGTNTVAVVATDYSGNARTNTYEVDVSGSGVSFDYDANGNLIEKDDGTDTWTYEWNARNELVEVLKNEQTVATFAYDPLGRRVEKDAGTLVEFTYDGIDILREQAGSTTTYYVHGPGIDEPLAKEAPGSAIYYHADALGTVLKVSDDAASIAQEYRYDSFGKRESGSADGYSFTGREWDAATGLYYYRARYYDPAMARFVSEDPVGLAGGFNLFSYVSNVPLSRSDPFGLVDLYVGYEVDLAAGSWGVEFGHGIVVDLDDLGSSGVYRNYGPTGGGSAGIAWTAGACVREVEGWAGTIDINAKHLSVTGIFDEQGPNGIGIGRGPGVGVSTGAPFTETLTVRDAWNWLVDSWNDVVN